MNMYMYIYMCVCWLHRRFRPYATRANMTTAALAPPPRHQRAARRGPRKIPRGGPWPQIPQGGPWSSFRVVARMHRTRRRRVESKVGRGRRRGRAPMARCPLSDGGLKRGRSQRHSVAEGKRGICM